MNFNFFCNTFGTSRLVWAGGGFGAPPSEDEPRRDYLGNRLAAFWGLEPDKKSGNPPDKKSGSTEKPENQTKPKPKPDPEEQKGELKKAVDETQKADQKSKEKREGLKKRVKIKVSPDVLNETRDLLQKNPELFHNYVVNHWEQKGWRKLNIAFNSEVLKKPELKMLKIMEYVKALQIVIFKEWKNNKDELIQKGVADCMIGVQTIKGLNAYLCANSKFCYNPEEIYPYFLKDLTQQEYEKYKNERGEKEIKETEEKVTPADTKNRLVFREEALNVQSEKIADNNDLDLSGIIGADDTNWRTINGLFNNFFGNYTNLEEGRSKTAGSLKSFLNEKAVEPIGSAYRKWEKSKKTLFDFKREMDRFMKSSDVSGKRTKAQIENDIKSASEAVEKNFKAISEAINKEKWRRIGDIKNFAENRDWPYGMDFNTEIENWRYSDYELVVRKLQDKLKGVDYKNVLRIINGKHKRIFKNLNEAQKFIKKDEYYKTKIEDVVHADYKALLDMINTAILLQNIEDLKYKKEEVLRYYEKPSK